MNIYEYKVLKNLYRNPQSNQRTLSKETSLSLGLVNKSIQFLKQEKYISDDLKLSEKGIESIEKSRPDNAIILCAGFGLRMVPINLECPKALLSVDNERLVERIINQLHEKNIFNITLVVGFLKEKFEYLIDKYNVELVYNKDYSTKNNIVSVNCVKNLINNTYIIPCDIWCQNNPFDSSEKFSWYMVDSQEDETSTVRINRQQLLENIKKGQIGNKMIGISYINQEDSITLKNNLTELCKNTENHNKFWEEALFSDINVYAKVPDGKVVEINSYEQLREIDGNSKNLKNDALEIICTSLNCKNNDIKNITTLKKGMTNRSFIFTVKDKRYIMRIPGEGTNKLINRKQEYDVYKIISGKNICDEVFYINPDNGYKITSFIENSRCCDQNNVEDLTKCMKKLRDFHNLNLRVNHEFDIFGQMNFYESLWNGNESVFEDYETTKSNVLKLIPFIETHKNPYSLTHIDAICDNFLISQNNNNEEIQLIDWEYAGMQDPHVDIAMFCIYSMYKRDEVDRLIDIYFENNCPTETRIKIYCYIAACGLLWSNWCEYKRQFGIEFGEYHLRQYRYAKEYYKLAVSEMAKLENK